MHGSQYDSQALLFFFKLCFFFFALGVLSVLSGPFGVELCFFLSFVFVALASLHPSHTRNDAPTAAKIGWGMEVIVCISRVPAGPTKTPSNSYSRFSACLSFSVFSFLCVCM